MVREKETLESLEWVSNISITRVGRESKGA